MPNWGLLILTGIPHANHFTPIFIKIGDKLSWDALSYCVVFAVSGDFLALADASPVSRLF
jgi:hypothetical protein